MVRKGIPLTMTMRDCANQAGSTTLEGRYDLTVVCRKAFGTESYEEFAASPWFTSNTEYPRGGRLTDHVRGPRRPAHLGLRPGPLRLTPAAPSRRGSLHWGT